MTSPRWRPAVAAVVLLGTVLVAGAGGAVAGSMVTGAQIRNGTVTGADVRDRSLGTVDLSRRATASLRGRRGPQGRPGTARAWARVASDGAVVAASRGLAVDRRSAGVYCISAPGVRRPAVAVATPDLTDDRTAPASNGTQSFVEIGDPAADCGPGADVVVRSFTRFFFENGSILGEADSGFHVVVP
ncbi:hypothetical protein GCM10023340_01520 [Nocardioides marinquilinus]|uniref:Uncharacterized protein n=1 Tax=Nocardioides marinquilinus TaxID=1210400 RepID=A0ABP9P4T1_9ACTN